MSIKIEPRKESDKGGYLCLPLCKNVPERKDGSVKIHCPVCGEMCWWNKLNIGVMFRSKLDGAMCTECAIRKGAGNDNT